MKSSKIVHPRHPQRTVYLLWKTCEGRMRGEVREGWLQRTCVQILPGPLLLCDPDQILKVLHALVSPFTKRT